MKRILKFATLGLVIVMAAGIASAQGRGEGSGDLVAGTGQILIPSLNVHVFVHVNAKSGPAGEDPRGRIIVRNVASIAGPLIDIQGRITCVTVQGNAATVGFEVTKSKEGSVVPEGFGGIFSFVDNGQPGASGNPATSDKFEGHPLQTPPTTCPLQLATQPVTKGNYIIRDAP
jgi:hypothetical protein